MLGVTFHRLGRHTVGVRRRSILDDVNYAVIAALVICFARLIGFVYLTFWAIPRFPPAAALEGLNSE